jgi:hypothetical protein
MFVVSGVGANAEPSRTVRASARRRDDGGKVGISMPDDDDDERRPITVQSLSNAELIKLLQFHDDDEFAEASHPAWQST